MRNLIPLEENETPSQGLRRLKEGIPNLSYKPHQGKKEMERRKRQIEKGMIK